MALKIQTSISLLVFGLVGGVSSISTSAHARGPLREPKYPIVVHGGGENSFTPAPMGQELRDADTYDAIIVGGGLAGLSAGIYLTDSKKKVLILEKEDMFGGLAAGSQSVHGIRYDRGAAYWTDTYEEEEQILKHIGLGDFRKHYAIHEPADSYFWNGQLYLGIWEHETLEKLPASFSVFKYLLKMASDKGQIPNQPFEQAEDLSLDQWTAAEWVRLMPTRLRELAEKGDKKAEELLARFQSDPKVDKQDPMGDVIGLLDLYCRSALGSTTDQVSAVAFANFYVSEIETRYTTTIGTGNAAEKMQKMLGARPKLAHLRVRATVTKIQNLSDKVVVRYNLATPSGKLESHIAEGKYAVFSAQLKLAPRLIEGLAGTEQAAYMEGLGYSHYSVHIVFVKGHPYRATYDTWVRAKDYSEWDFTDLILGRWMDPRIRGYEGMRDIDSKGRFTVRPPDDEGILSIYHPLPASVIGQGYDDVAARELAQRAVERMTTLWPPLVGDKPVASKIAVKRVETNRWPYSVHVPRPGHFKTRAKIMRRPFRRVFFANNNLGTPSFEEALFRGHCAADRILKELDSGFEFEKWTKCPRAEDDEH